MLVRALAMKALYALAIYVVLSATGIGVSRAWAACELQGQYGERSTWVNCSDMAEAYAKAESIPVSTWYASEVCGGNPDTIVVGERVVVYLDTKAAIKQFNCNGVDNWNNHSMATSNAVCATGTNWDGATHSCVNFDPPKSYGCNECPNSIGPSKE